MIAGIYIHIPFCKKACHYCDFHFSTSLARKSDMVKAIVQELELKKSRLAGYQIQSIYFGGGTPSLLDEIELGLLFDTLNTHYQIAPNAEITLEANPDDLSSAGIKKIKQFPINRFSIGIQSFFEEDLKWMNRAHNASEALSCVPRSQDAGFEKISLDLIYGYPLLSQEKWQHNLETAIAFQIPHLSAYALTVEERTALAHQIRKGLQVAPLESQAAQQFLFLQDFISQAGFEAYEISNYAYAQQYAIHNTNYWRGIPYLGIGPSAHGFDGQNRSANIANNQAYLQALHANQLAETWDYLSPSDRLNEYIMTALRTQWGIDLEKVTSLFGEDKKNWILQEAETEIQKGHILQTNKHLTLSREGKLFADGIAASLFWEDH